MPPKQQAKNDSARFNKSSLGRSTPSKPVVMAKRYPELVESFDFKVKSASKKIESNLAQSSSISDGILTRQSTSLLTNAFSYSAHEHSIRRHALLKINEAATRSLSLPDLVSIGTDHHSAYHIGRLVSTDYAIETELSLLHRAASPIGSALLPEYCDFTRKYAMVDNLITAGKVEKAVDPLLSSFSHDLYINPTVFKHANKIVPALAVGAVGLSGFEIMRSEDKPKRALQEVLQIGGGMAGSYLAGSAAASLACGPLAPHCLLWSVTGTIAGALIGTEIGHQLSRVISDSYLPEASRFTSSIYYPSDNLACPVERAYIIKNGTREERKTKSYDFYPTESPLKTGIRKCEDDNELAVLMYSFTQPGELMTCEAVKKCAGNIKLDVNFTRFSRNKEPRYGIIDLDNSKSKAKAMPRPQHDSRLFSPTPKISPPTVLGDERQQLSLDLSQQRAVHKMRKF